MNAFNALKEETIIKKTITTRTTTKTKTQTKTDKMERDFWTNVTARKGRRRKKKNKRTAKRIKNEFGWCRFLNNCSVKKKVKNSQQNSLHESPQQKQ